MPCGLVAKSFFNDTYTLKGPNGSIPINDKGIAWESDKEYKFKTLAGNNAAGVPYADLYW
jgi:LEM3 (ligand-effect modulator 3) family / CDC50 family